MNPQDLVKAIEALTKANQELVRLETERQRRDQQRLQNAKADAAEKKKEREEAKAAKEEADRKSDPIGKLVASYRASGGAGQATVGALRTGNLTGAIESLMGAGRAGSAAVGATGALGVVASGAGAVVGVAAGLYALKAALDQATAAQIQNYRELSKVSGVMASVLAQRDVRELIREREIGDRTARGAAALTKAEQDRADAGKELDIVISDFKSGFLAGWNEFATTCLKAVNKYLGLKADEPPGPGLGQIIGQEAKKIEAARDRHRRRDWGDF